MNWKNKSLVFFVVMALISCSGSRVTRANPTELALTAEYSLAARELIETHEESKLDSLSFAGPDRLVILKAQVEDLIVIEATAEKLRVIACVKSTLVQLDSANEPITDPWTREFRGVYIFVPENDRWRLANFLDTTDPEQTYQDWDSLPEDLKSLSGPIEDFAFKQCVP
ncbi:MAG: hypothetical protein KIT08_00060 [Anaerolineales bacterium]|nr:MAG: hypothetical protein KIT08_00060 [Anaerolineales bacterium]